MKGLKTKLMSAVAMLMVSAVMLVGTSFAWYTLSTNPEVAGIKATAVANQNLEIALLTAETDTESDIDELSKQATPEGAQGSTTGNYYTWGNLVDLTNIVGDVELRPATYTTNVGLQIPKYGTDGRITSDNYQTLKDKSYSTESGKKGWVYVNGDGTNGSDSTKYALRVDYMLRTNVAGNISLSTATNRDSTNKNSDMGGGSTISQINDKTGSLKVVFKVTKDGEQNSTWVPANNSDSTTTDGVDDLSATIISGAQPNDAYKVQMYVYLNGLVVTNEDAGEAIDDLAVNVQFTNSGITDAGAMKK